MQLGRPAFAVHPLAFGRRGLAPAKRTPAGSGADLKLFASTFAAGFLFVSILLA